MRGRWERWEVRAARAGNGREYLGGALKVSEGVGVMGVMGVVGVMGGGRLPWIAQIKRILMLFRILLLRLRFCEVCQSENSYEFYEFSPDGELFCEYIVICCWELKFCYKGLGLR